MIVRAEIVRKTSGHFETCRPYAKNTSAIQVAYIYRLEIGRIRETKNYDDDKICRPSRASSSACRAAKTQSVTAARGNAHKHNRIIRRFLTKTQLADTVTVYLRQVSGHLSQPSSSGLFQPNTRV